MINQTQYGRLVADVKSGLYPLHADLADLLESYEVLHAVVNGLCEKGSPCVGQDAFDSMYTEDGDQRVELLVHGRAR